jgi:bifunctional oligoribonuclease and PAP phosphatase NrnA
LKEKNIYKTIAKYQNIVIARHIGPDPDAVASQMALKDSIKLTFPKKNVLAAGIGVARFRYLGDLDKIDESSLEKPLLIVSDVPNISRIDGVTFNKYDKVIKIDHHPFEDKMGLEIVDESASSASEVVARLIYKTRLKMNKEIASKLYIGMASDSDRFLVPTTTSKTFEIASKLINDYKLDLNEIYTKLYERPIADIRFQSFLTLNMTITENGFGYMKITTEMIKEYGVDPSTPSNLVNNFNYIKEMIAWAFITYDEKQELYKVNIRSRGPVINEVASKYNGGGHKYASGARIKNEDDIDKLIYELDETCKIFMENKETILSE